MFAIRNIVCFFLAAFLSREAAAQANKTQGKFRITVQPTQLIFGDIPVNVELIFKQFTVGATAGYRFTNKNFDLGGSEISGYFLEPDRQALTFGLNSKYYFKTEGHWYVDAQLFYRLWWKEAQYYNNIPTLPEYSFSSSRINVYGSKLLFGYSTALSDKGVLRPVLMVYGGVGLRGYVNVSKYTFKDAGQAEETIKSETSSIKPTVQMGLSIGVGIFPKSKEPAR
jgi:hypothetical protein